MNVRCWLGSSVHSITFLKFKFTQTQLNRQKTSDTQKHRKPFSWYIVKPDFTQSGWRVINFIIFVEMTKVETLYFPCPPPPPGERVLASGSVQLPRFTLLESGSLLISPSHISDAGTYTCMASNSRGIDEASAELLVWGKRVGNSSNAPIPLQKEWNKKQ